MAAFEPMKLVAENLELAKQNGIINQRAVFYETNFTGMRSQVDTLNERVVQLQTNCIDLLKDVDSLRSQLDTVHKISTLRAESNQRLSTDLEAAKIWAHKANETLGNAGIVPIPEPMWESVGYNILHPEDVGP